MFESDLFVPRFVVCPDEPLVVKDDAWPACLLRDFAASTDRHEEEAFVAAAQWIAAMAKRGGRTTTYVEIPLTVVISLSFLTMDDERVDAYARLLWADVAAVRSKRGFPAAAALVSDVN